jgi:2-amino-4-hydroxy-6-hydroxymethyldihydropteridine diphosphokinase
MTKNNYNSKIYTILLGGNIGDTESYFRQAKNLLEKNDCFLFKASSLLKNKAWGNTQQADFINQVIEVLSDKEPQEFLLICQTIELQLHRKRTEKWGPRTIDIDILFVESQIINTDKLIVPHPMLHNRMFTLQLLLELKPYFIHPLLKETLSKLFIDLQKAENQTFTIKYDASKCIFSQNCEKLLPSVYNRTQINWIDSSGATLKLIEASICNCPSGALRIEYS